METNEKQFWFPAKKYGWGWGPPRCWQGWVVIVVFLLLMSGGGIFLPRQSFPLFVIYAIVVSTAFFMIVVIKGEKPRWRWGKD
jgi:hypothetical protein